MSKRIDMKNRKKEVRKAKPDNTPQGHADEMSKHVNWLCDNKVLGIATLDNEGVPYIAIMMRADKWTLAGKRFILKGNMKPELYSR